MLLVANFGQYKMMQKSWNMIETLAHGYSYESTQRKQKMQKNTLKNDWNPKTWVLIWENWARAFQWIPTWQGLDENQKSLHPCALDENRLSIGRVNPFTLKSSSRNIICYFHTFENNLGMKQNFTKYLKKICCLSSDQLFSFKCFQKNAFIKEIFPKSSGLFWPLCV